MTFELAVLCLVAFSLLVGICVTAYIIVKDEVIDNDPPQI